MPTLELEIRRAPFAPATWNAEARTVEAVISTGADVQRRDSRGPFTERLDLSQVDPASLVGLPVLTDHRQGVVSTVGVIAEARREADNLVATIRFSAAADAVDAVTKVAEGVLRGLSIGYAATSTRETTEGGRRIRTVTPAIREVSLVPIPADPASLIRSHSPMPEIVTPDPVTDTPPPALESRAAINAQIRALADTTGLNREWADAQIDAAADIATAYRAALDALVERGGPALRVQAHVGPSNDDPAVTIERQAEALFCQATGQSPSDSAREFMGLSVHDHARACIVRNGDRAERLSNTDLVRSAMGTSDFPLILDGVAGKTMRFGYGAAESPLKVLTRPRPMKDFRPLNVLEIGPKAELEEVTEHGEIKSVALAETGETVQLATFARKIALTRKALINDDIGAFAEVAVMAGRMAAEKEAKLLATALTGAPKMRDGQPLFHSAHANVAGSGGAISVDTLSAARQSLRTKTGLDGVTPANVVPKFLVVGAAQETAAEQVLATLAATKSTDVNPFSGRLSLVVDARITGNGWYVIADPAMSPVFEFLFLASAPGPQIETREGFDTLGREWRVVLDSGVGVVDTRGAYKNPGA